MKKSKSRLKGIITLLCTIPVLYLCFAEKTYVEIEDEFFTGELVSGNQSVIHFNENGTFGFGYFFIQGHNYDWYWDNGVSGEVVNATLEYNGSTITCSTQIRGYYTTNFLNFGMFPIDENTASKSSNGIQLLTGGLFANCKNGSTSLGANNIYGYVKRQYGKDGENIHEIWAGITETGWANKSTLEIASGDLELFNSTFDSKTRIGYKYYQNQNIALSGIVYDSIAKASVVSPKFLEKILLDIPNEYFENTKAISGNRNEIYYNSVGINGYGVFLLGTGIEGNFEATDLNNVTLVCSKQIDGYYLKNISDFGMFPLDQATAQYKKSNNKIDIVNGGLYYECREKNSNTPYNGVFGYIKWKYGHDNTHEIRVGIDSDGKWLPESPLEIIYSENAWNEGRSLSGTYHSSLAKNGKVVNRLFGDIMITLSGENIPASGTYKFSENNIAPLVPIDYSSQYKTNNLKIYIKSSEPGTNLYYWDIYSHDGGAALHTGGFHDKEMENIRTSGGFYGLFEVDLPVRTGMREGSIYAFFNKHEQERDGEIVYELVNATPELDYQKTPNNICRSDINVRASATNYPTLFKYTFTETDDDCKRLGNFWINNGNYTGGAIITGNYGDYIVTGRISINDDKYNHMYLCLLAQNDIAKGYKSFIITGLDTTPPSIDNNAQTIFTGYECSSIQGYVRASETGECSAPTKRQFLYNGRLSDWIQGQDVPLSIRQIAYFSAKNNEVGEKTIIYTGKDNQENAITGEFTMQWLDIPVTGENFSASVAYKNGTNLRSTVNRKDKSNAHAGSCENVIATRVECDNSGGTATLDGDFMYYEYNHGLIRQGWYDVCRITITDEDSESTITVVYDICYTGCTEILPEIVGGNQFVDRCYTGKYTHAVGTFLNSSFCNIMPITKPSETQPTKYTSGSNIVIDLNYDGTVDLESYRASCIESDTYCSEYETGRNGIGCDDIYSGYYENVLNCTRSNKTSDGSCNYDYSGEICETVCTKADTRSIYIPFVGTLELGRCIKEDNKCPKDNSCRREQTYIDYSDQVSIQTYYTYTCSQQPTCRRGCSADLTGYLTNVLGCNYSTDHSDGQCLKSESISFFGLFDIDTRSNNGLCRRCLSEGLRGSVFDSIQQCHESRDTITQDPNLGIKCKDGAMKSARSDRIPIEKNNNRYQITRDLETGSGCSNYGNLVPNGSKFQGERTVRIQAKDNDGNFSEKRESDIVVYDLGTYESVVGYGNTKSSPTATPYSNISQPTLNSISWTITVEDTGLIYGLNSATGAETTNETILTKMYQSYVKPISRYSIGKNIKSAWMMKGICATGGYQTVTGIFDTHINDNCICAGPSCSGNYLDFINYGLTGWIPAIDYGCKRLQITIKTGVTLTGLQNDGNYRCTGELTSIDCEIAGTWNIQEFSTKENENAEDLCKESCNNSQLGCYPENGSNEEVTTCKSKFGTTTNIVYTKTLYNTARNSNACDNYCSQQYNTSDPCYDQSNKKTNTCRSEFDHSEWTMAGTRYYYNFYYNKKNEVEVEDPTNTIFYYYDKAITKSNCKGSGYDSCYYYSCSEYNKDNTFTCPYNKCINFGSGCLSYETRTYTTGDFIDKEGVSCSCMGTETEPIFVTGTVDQNKYRCVEMSGNENRYECFKCINYECVEKTNECKEDAYSTGVTYFLVDMPQKESWDSHLKVQTYENERIAYGGVNHPGSLVDLFFSGNKIGKIFVTGYHLSIQQTNQQNRPNNVNININVSSINPNCLCDDGYFGLLVHTGLLKDFGINSTNSLSVRSSMLFEHVYCNPSECDECSNYNINSVCTSEADRDCFCKYYPNDTKCYCYNNNSTGCLCNSNSCNYCFTNSEYTTEDCEELCGDSNDDPNDPYNTNYCENIDKLLLHCATEGIQGSGKECVCKMDDENDLNGQANLESYDCKCFNDWCTDLFPGYFQPNDEECVKAPTPDDPKGICCTETGYTYDYNYCNCNQESNYECNLANQNPCSGAFCNLFVTETPSLGEDASTACSCINSNMSGRDRGYFPQILRDNYNDYNGIIFKVVSAGTPRCSCIIQNSTYDSGDDYCTCNGDDEQCWCRGIDKIGIYTFGDDTYQDILTGQLISGNILPNPNSNTGWKPVTLKGINPLCSGNFEFKGDPTTCPGFTGRLDTWGCIKTSTFNDRKMINGKSPAASFDCTYNIKVTMSGEFDGNGDPIRSIWSGCFVIATVDDSYISGDYYNYNAQANNKPKIEIELKFKLKTGDSAFKAGPLGDETNYLGKLSEAITKYSGDDAFYFYITNQSRINLPNYSGVLGSVDYDIRFNTGVADEFYTIEGEAIIDGYKKNLETKKRIYNYANPKGNLFTFPEY